MKWVFEIEDVPSNPAFPVVGTQHFTNGAKKGPYYFSLEDFMSALKSQPDTLIDIETEEVSTPPLPMGTIRYAVDKISDMERTVIEIPKRQWQIQYGETNNEFYTIGFPRMVVQYKTQSLTGGNKSRIRDVYIHAVLDNKHPITDTTELYLFPYPNVWQEDGRVCWGRNQALEINELVELERMFNWFISAPFNEELGVKTIHGIPNFKLLIEEIKDQEFNDDWLLPDRKNETFGDLFKNKK